MSQTPSIHITFQSHSLSLTNLHVVDAHHFITIGTDTHPVGGGSDDSLGGGVSSAPKTHTQPPAPEPYAILPTESPDYEMSQLSLQAPEEAVSFSASASSNMESSIQYSIKSWEYGKPPKLVKAISDVGPVVSSTFHCHSPPGNMFLGLGMRNGVIKIYNIPSFTISSELHFPEMKGRDCIHTRLNLSREAPLITAAYYRNPFRDLILTSVWSDGKVMVCQVAKQ